MEPLLTLKSKNIPKYYTSIRYGIPYTLLMSASLIGEEEYNKVTMMLLIFLIYLIFIFTFDKKAQNTTDLCQTIEVFHDYILINSSNKLLVKDIKCYSIGPVPQCGIAYPCYELIYIKDLTGRILHYKFYTYVNSHEIFKSSDIRKFLELTNDLKLREDAIEKGNEMARKLKAHK